MIQGDADTDLADYPDDAFDYVILSQTLQATRHPRRVLEQMLRIGRHAIVSFPNFGHWRIRAQAPDRRPHARHRQPARTPGTTRPNIHFCTIRISCSCATRSARIDRTAVALNAWGKPLRLNAPWWFWNLFGEQAVFLLSREGDNGR